MDYKKLLEDRGDYKSTPTPAGPTGPNMNDSTQAALAESTWRHASEFNKRRLQEVKDDLHLVQKELELFRIIEKKLSPVYNLEDSLKQLAEIFITRYPQEDAEVVKRLIAMVIDPVERKLEEDDDVKQPVQQTTR